MPMSLRISASLNGSSNVRLRMRWRMWCSVIQLWPVLAFSTSTMAAGSSP